MRPSQKVEASKTGGLCKKMWGLLEGCIYYGKSVHIAVFCISTGSTCTSFPQVRALLSQRDVQPSSHTSCLQPHTLSAPCPLQNVHPSGRPYIFLHKHFQRGTNFSGSTHISMYDFHVKCTYYPKDVHVLREDLTSFCITLQEMRCRRRMSGNRLQKRIH